MLAHHFVRVHRLAERADRAAAGDGERHSSKLRHPVVDSKCHGEEHDRNSHDIKDPRFLLRLLRLRVQVNSC